MKELSLLEQNCSTSNISLTQRTSEDKKYTKLFYGSYPFER